MPGSWTHLAARFFDVVSARPLSESERLQIRAWLAPTEQILFFAQHAADQRHGFECGSEIAARRSDRPDLVRAALLHDVGKRHARLGAPGRVVASVLTKVGLPTRGRLSMYMRHGQLAADELQELGVEGLTVEFARHHHGTRPHHVPESDWKLLAQVDRARLPGDPPA